MGLRTNGTSAPNLIQAETRRDLAPVPFAASQLAVLDIPRDTVIKRMEVTLIGTTVVTYASGSPVASPIGSMDKLCPRMDIVIDGQRTVKSISPYIQQQLNHLYAGNRPRRAYSTGASITTLVAGTEAPSGAAFVYPATTETLLINEAMCIHFEMPWSYAVGRAATMLNVRGVSSAEMRFAFSTIESLQVDGGAVSIAYSSTSLTFQPTIIEARDVPADARFLDFKETVTRWSYSGQQSQAQIDLPRGNALAGLGLLVRNGGSARALFDRGIRNLNLAINGQQQLQYSTFQQLQLDNQVRYGANDPMASSAHSLQGFAFMNLLKNGDVTSALNTTLAAGVDRVTLQVDTAPSSGTDAATYTTNPLEIAVHSMEIVSVPVSV